MNPEQEQYHNDLDRRLWTAANKLLPMFRQRTGSERNTDGQ
jgi:hypothetical protein